MTSPIARHVRTHNCTCITTFIWIKKIEFFWKIILLITNVVLSQVILLYFTVCTNNYYIQSLRSLVNMKRNQLTNTSFYLICIEKWIGNWKASQRKRQTTSDETSSGTQPKKMKVSGYRGQTACNLFCGEYLHSGM